MGSSDYRRVTAADADQVADFLAAESWPFHARDTVDPDRVRQLWRSGYYDSDGSCTFWILVDEERAGLIHLFDLKQDRPTFDLRLHQRFRGKGVGEHAVRWLTAYLFREFPALRRIEGTTRADNAAMCRLFLRCGFVKESHRRRAWSESVDAVGYAILREDWSSGTVTPIP
ncbi:N-acetyltransferase [Pseudonocardiaceae bacterium YIM PH 21723]|nr:N-acetyltransferase [Pseudonocardiaceae bacterium YIM PH 21723]